MPQPINKPVKNKKICIFGGTFNPPHIGHRMIVNNLLQLDFDEIIIMPCYKSPHKKSNISFKNRVEMVEIFCKQFNSNKVQLSLFEINKRSTTYTFETIAHFVKSDIDLYFALGTDTLADLDNWENSDFIKQHVTFVLATRKQSNLAIDSKVIYLNNEILDISSSDIRAGKKSEYLDKEIIDYISNHNLYN